MTEPAPGAVPAAAQAEETVNVTLFDLASAVVPGFVGYGMASPAMPPPMPPAPLPGGIVPFPGMPGGAMSMPGGGWMSGGSWMPGVGGMPGGSWMPGGGGMPGMMSIRADRDVVKAGPVKINVVNGSRGMAHDLVVSRVNADEFWLRPDYMLWVSKSDKDAGTGPLQPGQSKTLSLTLPAGNYVLASSLDGDFASGMMTRLKVTN